MKLRVYELDDGEQWWYAAESEEEALRLHIAPLVPPGTDLSDLSTIDDPNLPRPLEEIEISPISDDTVLPVYDEDLNRTVERTAKEWASEGKGLVGCTVW